jgi:hypothetical protein
LGIVFGVRVRVRVRIDLGLVVRVRVRIGVRVRVRVRVRFSIDGTMCPLQRHTLSRATTKQPRTFFLVVLTNHQLVHRGCRIHPPARHGGGRIHPPASA